jgi:hypothetical protein
VDRKPQLFFPTEAGAFVASQMIGDLLPGIEDLPPSGGTDPHEVIIQTQAGVVVKLSAVVF